MSTLQVFQDMSSAWRPGKGLIEVEVMQVCWVRGG